MTNRLNSLPEGQRWRLLVDAALKAMEAEGYSLNRVPGRGLSNIWNVEKNGKKFVASIRTTRDRWIAFPPLDGGKKWKTLDEVDVVAVAAVDSKENPRNIEVYVFPADDVRKRFNDAFAARTKAGQVNKDKYGMWVGLDQDKRGIAASVGSGIVDYHKPIANYSIDALISEVATEADDAEPAIEDRREVRVNSEPTRDPGQSTPGPSTIAEVMSWVRQHIAEAAGVSPEAVRLDLKIEY